MLWQNIKEIWQSSMYPSVKIKDTLTEIKYGLQRLCRGYDDSLVWGLGDNVLYLIKRLLIDFRDTHSGHPIIPGEIESDEDYVNLLNIMIYHIDEFESNALQSISASNHLSKLQSQYHKDQFFKLFVKYHDYLWD